MQRGFSLVELLAVVLILSVVSAIAVPLYLNHRKTSAARICTDNVTAIAVAESAYATRFGLYSGAAGAGDTTTWAADYTTGAAGTTPSGGLIGAPEGLTQVPKCPLNNKVYTVSVDTITKVCIIACPNSSAHSTDTGVANTKWIATMQAAGADKSNGF